MSQRTRKARNVARDPRVAISITDRNQPHTVAVVRGRVTERIEGDPAWVIIDRLSHKHLGEPYSPRGVRTPRRKDFTMSNQPTEPNVSTIRDAARPPVADRAILQEMR